MKCFKWALLLHVFLAALMFVSASAVSADDADDADALSVGVRDTAPLIGAWRVSLTNVGTKASNPALYSFLPGGVLHQSENPMVDPMLGNLVFSNAHGAWTYDPEQDHYLIRYFKLVFQADSAYWGQEETTGILKLDKITGALKGTLRVGSEKADFNGARIMTTGE